MRLGRWLGALILSEGGTSWLMILAVGLAMET